MVEKENDEMQPYFENIKEKGYTVQEILLSSLVERRCYAFRS